MKVSEAMAVRLALSGAIEIAVTPAILSEYREVLERPKFKISRMRIDTLFSQLTPQVKLINPIHAVEISPDEADNRLLECAETINA